MLLYPITKSACAVKPFVEESRRKKKAPRGNAGQNGKHLVRRRKNSAKVSPKSTSEKDALTFTKAAQTERNLLLERISNVKRELAEVDATDHSKIAELRQIVAGIATRHRSLREQEDRNERQVQGKRSARRTLALARIRGEFDRPEWAQPSDLVLRGDLESQVDSNAPLTQLLRQIKELTDLVRGNQHQSVSHGDAPSEAGGRNEIETRGRQCCEIIEEMKRIRSLVVNGGRTMEEIRKDQPNFHIWNVVRSLPNDDQEMFMHPRRWVGVVGYARGLLGKSYGRSPATIKDWVKAWRRCIKMSVGNPTSGHGPGE